VSENLVVDALFGVGVAAELVCCAGVLVMRTTYDRLHYSGAGSTIGAFCILAALLLREGVSGAGLQAIVAVALLFLLTPLVLTSIARAARRLDHGEIEPTGEGRESAG
jgi:monovalent cation/proton antiporter MnhG/PhaG subunit